VADSDPIRQLQHLLDDPGKVLERISHIQSALGSIHTPSSAAPPAVSAVADRPISQTGDDSYSGLLRTLGDLQSHIEERLRPLAQQTVQAEAERLREWMKREQRALDECLARIDENLLACIERISESQKTHIDLTALKKSLEELGAATHALPELSMSQDPSQIIIARLETLRRDGKI
jgi:vacuolar-type H+-ATPase subunit I/STV1